MYQSGGALTHSAIMKSNNAPDHSFQPYNKLKNNFGHLKL